MKNLTATKTHQMSRLGRRNLTIAAAAIAALSFSSCSSLIEKATEKAVEEGIEQAIEADSGENVELDFNADDGTFSIETEDGSFSVDGEEGTFVLETEDGTFEGSGDETGFEVTDENGTTVIDADFDETGDGSIAIETDDGTFSAGEGDWEQWPDVVTRPDFASPPIVSVLAQDGEVFAFATGEVTTDAQGAVDDYVATLDGFNVDQTGTAEDFAQTSLSNDEFRVDVSSSQSTLSVTVTNI